MAKKEWLDWFKCNFLEIVILILVLVLLVKVFSAPVADVTGKETVVQKELPLQNPIIEKATEEVGEQPLPETAEPNTSE